ncbi:hypothetical protein JAAARDRAFT_31481 [Jaapia argillacea MUCL 33604]|uniref:Uncharacterized protein n=1 Tax=Jaapia argillacea MUCL 33604 TaxID=933084 RepID=A0A067Q4M2_9AGAM|nr:hypothetical protein JAAARDRAFT_31481 [Jaapia argillacea MUCL 33604]
MADCPCSRLRNVCQKCLDLCAASLSDITSSRFAKENLRSDPSAAPRLGRFTVAKKRTLGSANAKAGAVQPTQGIEIPTEMFPRARTAKKPSFHSPQRSSSSSGSKTKIDSESEVTSRVMTSGELDLGSLGTIPPVSASAPSKRKSKRQAQDETPSVQPAKKTRVSRKKVLEEGLRVGEGTAVCEEGMEGTRELASKSDLDPLKRKRGKGKAKVTDDVIPSPNVPAVDEPIPGVLQKKTKKSATKTLRRGASSSSLQIRDDQEADPSKRPRKRRKTDTEVELKLYQSTLSKPTSTRPALPHWNLVKPPPSTSAPPTVENLSSEPSTSTLPRPKIRIWAKTRAELLDVFPELSKAVNGVYWDVDSNLETPILVIEGSAWPDDRWDGSNAIELNMVREYSTPVRSGSRVGSMKIKRDGRQTRSTVTLNNDLKQDTLALSQFTTVALAENYPETPPPPSFMTSSVPPYPSIFTSNGPPHEPSTSGAAPISEDSVPQLASCCCSAYHFDPMCSCHTSPPPPSPSRTLHSTPPSLLEDPESSDEDFEEWLSASGFVSTSRIDGAEKECSYVTPDNIMYSVWHFGGGSEDAIFHPLADSLLRQDTDPTLLKPLLVPPIKYESESEDELPLSLIGPTLQLRTNSPPEIQTLIDSHNTDTPVIIIISRDSPLAPLNVPAECGYTMLGVFSVASWKRNEMDVHESKELDSIGSRVKWTIRFEWDPQADCLLPLPEGLEDIKSSIPWWLPPKLPSESAQVPPPDGQGQLQGFTESGELIVPNESAHHPSISISTSASLSTTLQAPEPAFPRPVNSFTISKVTLPPLNSALFGRAWYCRNCGKVSVISSLRHRRCDGCKPASEAVLGYALELEQIRSSSRESASSAWDVYPPSMRSSLETWADGVCTYSYYYSSDSLSQDVEDTVLVSLTEGEASTSTAGSGGRDCQVGKNGVVVRHVVMRKSKALEEEVEELFRDIQVNVELASVRGNAGISAFQYYAGQGVDKGAPMTRWEDVPQCVTQAREMMEFCARCYGEDESVKINRLGFHAWVAAGNKKCPPVSASKTPLVFLCLGNDVSLTISSLSASSNKGAHASSVQAKSKAKIEDESTGELDVDVLEDVVPSTEQDETVMDTTGVAVDEPTSISSKLPTSVKQPTQQPLFVTLTHGDLMILGGGDFQYSMKRHGMSILLMGEFVEG